MFVGLASIECVYLSVERIVRNGGLLNNELASSGNYSFLSNCMHSVCWF